MEVIKRHPLTTVKILEPLQLREEEIAACLYHHEKVNGDGYPKGLKGEDIPLFARIIAIADAYSAMISERPYSRTMTPEEAGAELKANAGTQFDSVLVDAFMAALPQKK
jgi:HD-GYP domain-containing protein (c-di-GMP phosphodiesterase class II)